MKQRHLKEIFKLKLDNYKKICLIADKEDWCWNINCFCGHHNFVKSFLLLINNYPFGIEHLNEMREYLDSHSEQFQQAIKDVSIKYLSENYKFPNFLGYLGLGLKYSEIAEKENRVLTSLWIPQLISLMQNQDNIKYLEDILSNNKVLTWVDLKCVYNDLYPTRGTYYLVTKNKNLVNNV